ncbi:HAD-like domain-containing protein [Scenedesmus sp. NREL 46B-D3]|nr:HAD-like domain-containing protein [Scenedesmus sp. NREL 46B-D3]
MPLPARLGLASWLLQPSAAATAASPSACSSRHCARSSRTVCQAAAPAVQQSAVPCMLDEISGLGVLQQLDTIIFDCDGVLWRGNDTIPNAVEVVSSSYTAAAYLASMGFGQSLQPGKHVLLLGSQGTADELAAAGLQVLDAEQLQLPVLESVDAMLQMQLVYASACLRELPGCLFVATNLDHADYIGNSRMMPGNRRTGVSTAACAWREPAVGGACCAVNVGKGGSWLFPHLLANFKLQPSRTAVVGDRLDTDIAMGKQGGLVTLLPLTGVTTMQGALSAASGEQPDYIIPSVAALAGLPSS